MASSPEPVAVGSAVAGTQLPPTPRLQRALVLALDQARRLHQDHLLPEHLLLGLLDLNEGGAVTVLTALDADLTKLHMEVENHAQVGPGAPPEDGPSIPADPSTRQVWELTLEAARQLGSAQVGTGHLLLGILLEGQSLAAQILRKNEISLESAHERLLKLPEVATPAGLEASPSVPPKALPLNSRAERLLYAAQELAYHSKHEAVDTEHLLQVMIEADDQDVAFAVLTMWNIEFGDIRAAIAARSRIREARLMMGEIPLAHSAERVLELAAEEARRMGDSAIGTEHILLGLLREERGMAGEILHALGVRLEWAREKIQKFPRERI
jgi:ATP-dependent Clp protease ATP-binding subunit ClpA